MEWLILLGRVFQWGIENGHDIVEIADDIRNFTGGAPDKMTPEIFEQIKDSKKPAPPDYDEIESDSDQ